MWRDDFDGFDTENEGRLVGIERVETGKWNARERLFGVLGEHCDEDVVAYLSLCFVGCCYFYEDVAGI